MSDYQKLDRALTSGNFLVGSINPLLNIQVNNDEYSRTGNQALSIDSFVNVFKIETNKSVLLDPSDRNKFLIILKDPTTHHQIEILSSDNATIERANQQHLYQNQPVGTLITAHCAALGGSSNPEQIAHLDVLLPPLNGLLDWSFKQTDIGTFDVSKRIKSTDENDAKEELNRLRIFLDYIAITRKIGVQLQRYGIAKIPRYGVIHGIWGPEEWMVPPLSQTEAGDIAGFISLPSEIQELAQGLNQVYLLKSMSSRLALLWALTESIFKGESQPLLTATEVAFLFETAKNVATLRSDSGRLQKLRESLGDRLRLPLVSRNKLISENIAKKLSLNADEVYDEIKRASEIRGKSLHDNRSDDKRLKASEEYLRTILERYLQGRRNNT